MADMGLWETGAALVGDFCGTIDHPAADIVGGMADMVGGGAKVMGDGSGERNVGGGGDFLNGMLGFGKGVLGLGGDKMLPAVLGNFASSAGGALQAGMNILEASTHLDDMDKGSLIEKNDYWAAMGDAELGLAHAVLPWLGPEGQVADKLLSAGEFVVDTAGAVAGSADPDYKFGAGDVTGAMQRASDVSQISPLLNMMNPANPLAAVTSIHRMLQADDALDIFVGEPLQENAGALYDHFAG